MAAVSIEDIVSGAQEFAAKAVAGAEQKKEAFGKAQEAIGQVRKITETVAQDFATVKATEQAAELKAQAGKAEYAAAIKIDGQGLANSMIAMGVAQMEQNKALAGTLAQITKKTSIDFLDSPLQWVGAQITLPKDEEIARAQLAQVAQTHQAIQQTAQGFSSFAVTQDLQKQSVTQASATAATRIAASSALISAQQTNVESAKYDVEAINATLAASHAELTAASKIYEAQSNQEGQKMQQLAFDAQAQQRAFEQEFRDDAREAKKLSKSMDEATLNYINLDLDQRGLPRVTPEEAPLALKEFANGNSEMRKAWRNGRVISTQKNSQTHMGATPAEAAEYLLTVPSNIQGISKDTENLLREAVSQIPKDKVTPQEKAIWINKNVQETVNREYGNITKGSIFDAGEVSQYFGIQSIAQLPLVSKVLAPLAATGAKIDEPSLVLSAGLAAMKAGTITSSEFSSGVGELYMKASATNIAARRLRGFGIQIPDGGKAYNVKPDRWGSPVNLLDSTQLNRWIVEKAFEVQKSQSLINSTAPMGMRNFTPR